MTTFDYRITHLSVRDRAAGAPESGFGDSDAQPRSGGSKTRWVALICCIVFIAATSVLALERPILIAPSAGDAVATVSSRCPTFQWAVDADASAVEMVVFRLDDLDLWKAEEGRGPALAVVLEGAATGWTPSIRSCLEADRDYAWSIRAREGNRWGEWSRSATFRTPNRTVAGPPSEVSRVRAEPTEEEEPSGRLQTPASRAGLAVGAPPESDSALASENGAMRTSYPGSAALLGEQKDTSGETHGVIGIAHSSQSRSSGLVGESTFVNPEGGGRNGWVKAVVGRVLSSEGVAGAFENSAGGSILRGIGVNGTRPPTPTEVFHLAGDGDVTVLGQITAESYAGDGSGLENVEADTFNGIPASEFGDIGAVGTGPGLTGGWVSGDVEVAIGADALSARHLASAAVDTDEIGDGAVRSVHVSAQALTGADLAPGAVTASQIAAGAVIGGPGGDVADGSLLFEDFSSDQVQARVWRTCGTNSAIDNVTLAGTVGCEVDDFQRPVVEWGVGGSYWSATSRNGVPDYDIVSAVGRVCYLTLVDLDGLDGRSENASCEVLLDTTTNPDTWVLKASSTAGEDASSTCMMRCLAITQRAD